MSSIQYSRLLGLSDSWVCWEKKTHDEWFWQGQTVSMELTLILLRALVWNEAWGRQMGVLFAHQTDNLQYCLFNWIRNDRASMREELKGGTEMEQKRTRRGTEDIEMSRSEKQMIGSERITGKWKIAWLKQRWGQKIQRKLTKYGFPKQQKPLKG